jgi:nucleoside-diphosphate-sugar epimerase
MLNAPSGNIVVTGATGFLGSHFVREWLRTESSHVFALARAKDKRSAATRIAAALEDAQLASGTTAQALPSNWATIEGDVTQPLAGIPHERVEQLRARGVEVFWHFASDLRYEHYNHEATRRINVEGALHALALAIELGIKRFVYVSTAYVCGREAGLIKETLVPSDQEFSNGYEASKAEAERLLVAECERLGLPLTILRPSIVIGPRSTQSAYGSETGLFSLIHAVMWIRSSQSGQQAHLRIPSCPAAEINFIPVDCVVSDMLGLANSGFGSQPIYHLTSSVSVTVAQCWRVLSDVFGMHNVTLVPPDSLEPSPAERLIARRLGFFLSYITVDRRFQRTLSPAWTLDAAEFAGYVRNGLERVERDVLRVRSHAG